MKATTKKEGNTMKGYSESQNLTIGSKYDSKLDIKEIAKLVRKELKKFKKHGHKFSVRIDRFSMGQALRIAITPAQDFQLYTDRFIQDCLVEKKQWCGLDFPKYTKRAVKLLEVIERNLKQI